MTTNPTTGRTSRSLLAAAYRLTSNKREKPESVAADWAAEAWEMYRLVGELRFISNLLANRIGKARLFVGEKQPGGDPVEVTDNQAATAILESMGDRVPAIITRLALQLFVADGGYIVGLPKSWLTGAPDPARKEYALDEFKWAALSTSEVREYQERGLADINFEGHEIKQLPVDRFFLVRVWRPHPEKFTAADSPVASSLPVLRELVGLTKHISAQVDSRLAGAGVLFVPTSIEVSKTDGEDDDTDTSFSDSLTEAMMTSIADRDSAAAVVPLVVGVPAGELEHIKHITMAGSLDAEAKELRDEAIRRLALGLDCPPETLLGMGGMNHWSAWLVDDQTVTNHIEPPLTIIAEAITEQIFRPLMEAQGQNADNLVVWYDTSHMVNTGSDVQIALELYDRGVISAATLIAIAGLPPEALVSNPQPADAPVDDEVEVTGTPVETGPPTEGPPQMADDNVRALAILSQLP